MTLTFSRDISTSLPLSELWRLIVESFEDSRTSPVWPNDLETLSCEQLGSGATVQATYHVGPFDAPQTYAIPTFDPEARYFEYRTGPDHPLEGGGRVEVVDTSMGSRLQWSGEYRLRHLVTGAGAALFIKGWFEDRFFERLASNLRTFADKQSSTTDK